jgi:hypothetical protein
VGLQTVEAYTRDLNQLSTLGIRRVNHHMVRKGKPHIQPRPIAVLRTPNSAIVSIYHTGHAKH